MSGAHHIRTDSAEEFLQQKSIVCDSGCIIYTGTKTKEGYGRIDRTKFKKQFNVGRAHMLSYIISYGDYDRSLHVCHRCDNPPCINKEHLFLGTYLDNSNDKLSKGRQARGSTAGKSVLQECEAYYIKYLASSSNKDLAAIFKISPRAIRLIKSGINWRHI